MARARFVPDLRGYREFHRTATGMHAALEPFAQRIADRARASARVESAESAAERNRTPGRFRDSIHIERFVSPEGYHVVRVVADCDGAGAIELRDRTLGSAAG